MNKNCQEMRKQVLTAHRTSIQQRLQKRIEAAKAKGDEALLRQLEAEAKYFG